ncbi:MAG: VCBS repeat-containing protein [Candidatus Helarchaeota archaeon]|nr:VCBS repeat-containing protein [Candidatus Helarchaeota archaeon]
MKKKMSGLFIILIFMLMPLVTIQLVTATESFSDINFEEPHDNYIDTPPTFLVNSTPEQPWKKTDVDFTGSIGDEGEYAIEFSRELSLNGALPGRLAAVEGSVEVGFKMGIRYDITFGYEFGVDYYHWANDMAVSAGQEFSYCTYVEADPDTFSLWADISIEPFIEMWADFDVYLELAGYTIVDWEKYWSLDLSLPIKVSPNLDLGALLESGLLTPIGELYSSPKIGLGLELPGRLEYSLGSYAGVYFDAGVGVYAQFQIRGLLESLLELTGDANAKFDGAKSNLDLKYYDVGKENLKSINIHVPLSSAGKVVEILAHEFEYSIEPGILLSWDGHLDLGAYLRIPTPTKYIEVARTVTERVCDWLPWPLGKVCDTVTKTVFDWVEVAATVVPDIDWSWDYSWEAEDEWWIPFFTIPLLKSNAQALDRIKVLESKEYPLSITQNWGDTWSDNWTLSLGPSALRLSAYAGYALNMLLEGMLYSYYKPNDQIAGHPFNYYVGVDGDDAGDGSFGGSLAAGYSLDLKIPYMEDIIGQEVWIELIGYGFNTSEFSGLDIPLFEAEYSVGVVAISLSSEAEFADLDDLEIAQSANGFLGTWETEPFFTVSASLDGMLFQAISMNLGSVEVEFLFKGTGDLTGNISASGAGSFDSSQMQWDKPGDINYANIYPDPDAEKGDIIDILINNLKYNLDLDLVIRVSASLYAQYGYLDFSHDFEIDLLTNLEADVNEDVQEQIEVTAGFKPAKITDIPEEVTAGIPFLVKWETSNSTLGQTRLQYGQTPYPRAVYSDATSFQPYSGSGIHEFNETIILNNTGTWYFLVYLNSSTPPFHYYSKNLTTIVRPRLNITTIPQNATAGEAVTIEWNIFGPSSVESTNLRYSESPNPMSDPGIGTPIQSGSAGTYSTQITFDEVGIYYFVAHAQVDREGDDYFSEVVSIKILPNMTILILPSPHNASYEFTVNWSILGADYIDRTYLEYSQNASFAENVFSTVSQYGYVQNFAQTVALFVKGTWYFRVVASVNGIKDVYYSKEPPNITQVDPFSEINPTYPANVTATEPFKLNWWVFGYNTSVDKTQIFYDNDTDVLNAPLGWTTVKSGNNITDFSDTFTISQAGTYYFQANFSIDGDPKSWNSSVISILVMPAFNVTNYPPINATAFTYFDVEYNILGLDTNSTLVDLWYGVTSDIGSMTPLNQSQTGGNISGFIDITGRYYFRLNLTFDGIQYWSEVFTFMIVPHIEVMIPWDQMSDTNLDLTPGQFAIAGIPVTIEWIVRNTTVVNHTDIHFRADSRFEPELREIFSDIYKYDFTKYKIVTGLITHEQNDSGPPFHLFRQNVTFYVNEFTWIPFRIHANCDGKPYDYYANASGIPVYPAAEALEYNYTVVVDKQDITLNPRNFTVTWGLGYEVHNWTDTDWNNTPNEPGIVPNKVIGIKHANIHYMLNYDPADPSVLNRGLNSTSTINRSGPAYPAIFTDNITISSVGTYYFRIHVKYNYSSTNENFTYPQHINRSYWSPLYKINVISYGKYNTTIQVLKNPPPVSYADYDGDGDLDMLIGNNTGSSRKITLYFNDGTGNYTALPPREIINYTPPAFEEIGSITAGNFNDIPGIDFIMTNDSLIGSTVKGYIYLNDGLGNFVLRRSAFVQDINNETSTHATYAVADLDLNTVDDIVYYGFNDPKLYVDYGELDGGNLSGPGFDQSIPIESLILDDLDGTPIYDLIIGYSDNSVAVELDFPLIPGPTPLQNITATFNQTNYPLIGDFNNDGFNDTIIVNNSGEVIITLNITTLVPVHRVIAKAAGTPQGLTIGDFENDGDLDFVIGIAPDLFQFFFSNYTIDPSTWPGFSNQIVPNGGAVLATGDFNNDNFLDISAYRGDFHILHFLYDYVPPPTITNIDVSYNSTSQTINIENIAVFGVESEPINDTNAYFYWYTILDGTFAVVSPLANLTWNGNSWEALNVNVSYLPEGNYYVNVTFGDKFTFGNNSHALTLTTQFTIDHYDEIHGVGVSYIDNTLQKLNITVDIVNSSYTVLGNITGREAAVHSYIIRNATGHNVLVYNQTVTGILSYGNVTGTYRWEAVNVSTANLLPGDYFITLNFTDYLGYDSVTANSSFFIVQHVLSSKTTPNVTYQGNLTQMIQIRNVNIESSYHVMKVLGKGRARIYNYSIFNNITQAFTGLTGEMSWNGFNWYADVSVSLLPEGSYYINAFFKDKFNATITTANSSAFTVNHTIDLSSLNVEYTGFMVQEFNISVTPVSSYDPRGILNGSEALSKTFKIYTFNGSSHVVTGDLVWTGTIWNKIVDIHLLLENDYIVQVSFADLDANVTQNASIISVYHYIEISKPTFEYNFSTSELNISNFVATSSYHGVINDTSVLPTINSYTIISSQIPTNITGSFTYNGSHWLKSNINVTSLMFGNLTIYIQFEVNESYGMVSYSINFNQGTGFILLSAGNIEVRITLSNPLETLRAFLIVDVLPPNNVSPNEATTIGVIYRVEVDKPEVQFTATISISYSQAEVDSKGLDETLLSIYTFENGKWVEIKPVTRDPVNNIIIVTVNHLSYFVLMEGTAEPEGPNLLLIFLLIGLAATASAISVIFVNKRRKRKKPKAKIDLKIKTPSKTKPTSEIKPSSKEKISIEKPISKLEKLKERLNELETTFKEGKISQSAYERLKKDLEHRIQQEQNK